MQFKKQNAASNTELELDHELPPAENDSTAPSAEQGPGLKDPPSPEAELEKVRTERAAYLDRAARLQAEFDNFRKRNAKEQQEYREYALADALKQLLPILDSLWRTSSRASNSSTSSFTMRWPSWAFSLYLQKARCSIPTCIRRSRWSTPATRKTTMFSTSCNAATS
jgi:molecular chaperone GrpE (heat shock protein)